MFFEIFLQIAGVRIEPTIRRGYEPQ